MSRQNIRNYLKRIKPLRAGVQALKGLLARHREQIWVLKGKERSSGQPLSILFAGQLDTRNYIADLIFGTTWVETECSSVWKSRLLQHACRANGRHDLAILQMDSPATATDTGAAVFRAPCWVGGEKDLRIAPDFARRSSHIKSDIRRIRKNRLGYRVTREPAEFDRFYHQMYLPHIQRIFGDHAFLMSYEAMQAAIPDCELFLIIQDGQDIAGGILVYDQSDRVVGWSLGVKDGDDHWVREGALAAFEHLQAEYLLEKGYSRLHRGASRPFLNDGALCFKKNRGMHITECTAHNFIIHPVHASAGVRAFLQNNPFIYEDEGKMKGAIFVPGDAPCGDDAARLFHDWYIPGLDSLTLFFVPENQDHDLSIRTCGQIDGSGELKAAS